MTETFLAALLGVFGGLILFVLVLWAGYALLLRFKRRTQTTRPRQPVRAVPQPDTPRGVPQRSQPPTQAPSYSSMDGPTQFINPRQPIENRESASSAGTPAGAGKGISTGRLAAGDQNGMIHQTTGKLPALRRRGQQDGAVPLDDADEPGTTM